MMRSLTFLTAYALLHLPLFVLYVWPLFVGAKFRLGMLSAGLFILWCIPLTFAVRRLFRTPWWIGLRNRVQSLDR